jgi:hypothetical protein
VAEEWTVERELLARAVDSLNVLAHGRAYEGEPQRVPRPGEMQAQRASSAEEIAAFFGGGQ